MVATVLVCTVFILHFSTPTIDSSESPTQHRKTDFTAHQALSYNEIERKATKNIIPTKAFNREGIKPSKDCEEYSLTIEKYRVKPVVRGVIVRFPSLKADYYFVQFRWFYRSWIESEMFTLDRWRTDIIILIDDKFPGTVRKMLEHLDCHKENQRASHRQISRCILVEHKLISQKSKSQRQFYISNYPILGRFEDLNDNVDRLFGIYDYVNELYKTQPKLYDLLMVTTMNTFLTTQFGKSIPLKCSFLLGAAPDYSTWYSKTNQIIEFAHTLLLTLKESDREKENLTIDFSSSVQKLKDKFLFIENQVDIPCDSKVTTFRTSVYHLKCYAHSTSLFSERMFREKAYDGYEKEPFNIYIAREYATLMALQSKVMTLDDLHKLAVNVTRREIYT